MPVEIKSWLTSATFSVCQTKNKSIAGTDVWVVKVDTYKEVCAGSDEMWSLIPKCTELFQLMHHVAIWNKMRGLILISKVHRVIYGIFVVYKEEGIHAYNKILRWFIQSTSQTFLWSHTYTPEGKKFQCFAK